MTDNEIIKALECCSKPVIEECCLECPYYLGGQENCHKLLGDIIVLINRKQAEIERLKKEVNLVSIQFQDLQERYEEAHAEIEQWKEEANKYQKLWCIAMDDIEIAQFGAIQELAKRLKSSIYINTNLLVYQCEEVESVIDDIVKEMVGETNDI